MQRVCWLFADACRNDKHFSTYAILVPQGPDIREDLSSMIAPDPTEQTVRHLSADGTTWIKRWHFSRVLNCFGYSLFWAMYFYRNREWRGWMLLENHIGIIAALVLKMFDVIALEWVTLMPRQTKRFGINTERAFLKRRRENLCSHGNLWFCIVPSALIGSKKIRQFNVVSRIRWIT